MSSIRQKKRAELQIRGGDVFARATDLARRIYIMEIFRRYLGITTEFLLTTAFFFFKRQIPYCHCDWSPVKTYLLYVMCIFDLLLFLLWYGKHFHKIPFFSGAHAWLNLLRMHAHHGGLVIAMEDVDKICNGQHPCVGKGFTTFWHQTEA